MKKSERSLVGEVCYGGDYNPEQWDRDTRLQDMGLMKRAGVNMVSLGIFSWALLELSEGAFDFSWLDDTLDLLADHGIAADLATATASVPPWAAMAYPDIFPVDETGSRYTYGSRQTYCPNSPSYRRLAAALVRTLAERYKDHPALTLWHINNEYSCHVQTCYCDTCAAEFRSWLLDRYGSVEGVNQAWGTAFWSQHYTDIAQILPPRKTTAQPNPGQVLDYRRFMSDSLLACYRMERDILREITPDIPLTTNFMMTWKPLDYRRWVKEGGIDIISWDGYPDPSDPISPTTNAFDHDLMRSLGDGRPHFLMEMSPGQVNWRPVNSAKRPGLSRLHALQAVAHGADGVLYFQWRQSLKGAEKYHAACITHGGGSTGRIYREVAKIGDELKRMKVSGIPGSRYAGAKAAVLIDYDTWWAVEYHPGPSEEVAYRKVLEDWYRAFRTCGIAVDFVFQDSDLSGYTLVCAPLCHMVKPGFAPRVKRFVEAGGQFITGFFSGVVDEQDGVFPDGYPGPFSALLGIHVEEFSPLQPGTSIAVGEAVGTIWSEEIRLTDSATEVVAAYGSTYLAGEAAVTRKHQGSGAAWYVSTHPDAELLHTIVMAAAQGAAVSPLLDHQERLPIGVDVTMREHLGSGRRWLFLLNFSETPALVDIGSYTGKDLLSGMRVSGDVVIPATDGLVVELDAVKQDALAVK